MPFTTLRRAAEYVSLARSARKLRRCDAPELAQIARRHLVERLGQMRGLPQKMGQMLSFSADRESNDPAAALEYARLREAAEPLPLETLIPVLEDSWGRKLTGVVQAIAPRGQAASLGQVHQAVLKDGREVAIKIQYPGIRESLQSDLKLLGWLSLPVGNLRRGFDLSAYRQMILEEMEQELDYLQEAAHQRAFAKIAESNQFLQVPGVIDELSTSNVLVTEWATGEHWSEVQTHWTDEQKGELARGLMKLFLEMLFQHGCLHADLHPGNLRFRWCAGEPQLLLYDFGCVYQPDNDTRLALLRLIRATQLRNEPPLPLFLKLGFKSEFLEPLSAKLPALCQVLFEPFCVEYPHRASEWRLGERVADILGADRLNFRVAGPPEMVLLLRAFQGLNYYLRGLDAPVAWSRLLRQHLLEHAQAMDALSLPRADVATSDFTTLARHLRIRVRERGETKIQLTTDARGIDDLEDLLDSALRDKIAQRGIHLNQLTAEVRGRGYAPGPIFEWSEDEKEIAVWLE